MHWYSLQFFRPGSWRPQIAQDSLCPSGLLAFNKCSVLKASKCVLIWNKSRMPPSNLCLCFPQWFEWFSFWLPQSDNAGSDQNLIRMRWCTRNSPNLFLSFSICKMKHAFKYMISTIKSLKHPNIPLFSPPLKIISCLMCCLFNLKGIFLCLKFNQLIVQHFYQVTIWISRYSLTVSVQLSDS